MIKKAPNIFEQFWIMLFRVGRYGELSVLKTSKIVIFIILFNIIVGISVIGALFGKVQLMYGGAQKALENYIPDFTFSNHELSINEEIVKEFARDNFLLCVKTSVDEFTSNDITYLLNQKSYASIILVSKKNVLNYSGGSVSEIYYKDLKFSKLTKPELIEKIMSYVKLIKNFIPFYILAYLIAHPLNALLMMLLGVIISAIFQKKIKAGQLYKISIYVCGATITWSIVSFLIPFFVPIIIQYLFYIIVSIVYMIFAIMSTDFYNRSAEKKNPMESFGAVNILQPIPETALISDEDNPFSSVPLGLEEEKKRKIAGVKSTKPVHEVTKNPVPKTSEDEVKTQSQHVGPSAYTRGQSRINTVAETTRSTNLSSDKNVQAVNISANSQEEGGISILRNQLNIINLEPSPKEQDDSGIQKATSLVHREKPRVSANDEYDTEYAPADYTRPLSKMNLANEEFGSSEFELSASALELSSMYSEQSTQEEPAAGDAEHNSANDIVMIGGTCCQKSDLDLIDKFILVGLNDDARKRIQEIVKCEENQAEDILNNWSDYYKP